MVESADREKWLSPGLPAAEELALLCVGFVVNLFVDELVKGRAFVVGGERIASLLAGLGLSDHLFLGDILVRYFDVRSGLEVIKFQSLLL
jgi:hypothetical protein